MDNLLYYPYINVPNSDWTIRTLLYYETIGTIVPERYHEYDPFMKELMSAGLVVPISPNKYNSTITEVFTNYLDSDDFELKKRKAKFKSELKKIMRDSSLYGVRIHANKFDQQLFENLKQTGLAKHEKGNGRWYWVEKKTANELMTLTAAIIGLNMNYLPGTDKLKRSFTAVGLKKKHYEIHKKESKRREIILDNLIPFPKRIDLAQLQKFKNQNHQLLSFFKNKVEEIVLDSRIDKKSGLLDEKLNGLNLQKKELIAKMNESKLGSRLISVAGIVGGFPSLNASTQTDSLLGLLGLSSAIAAAVSSSDRPEIIFDQSGLKYLALIDRTLTKSHPY